MIYKNTYSIHPRTSLPPYVLRNTHTSNRDLTLLYLKNESCDLNFNPFLRRPPGPFKSRFSDPFSGSVMSFQKIIRRKLKLKMKLIHEVFQKKTNI